METDISAFLPPRAGKVVHFAPESGKTAEHFRRIQPKCQYLAVTGRKDAVAFLSSLSGVIPGDPETVSEKALAGADVIIYQGEALPLLTAEILRRHSSLLAPRGQMLFFLENPAYLGHFLGVLEGRGISGGLMSLEEAENLLKEAGLALAQVRALRSREDEARSREPGVEELLRAMGAYQEARGRRLQDPWVMGYLLRAVPGELPKPLLMESLLGEPLVTARVRLREPHAFLETEPGFRFHVAPRAGADLAALGQGFEQKILLRQRLIHKDEEEARRQIEAQRRNGFLTILELDDDPGRWKETYEKSKWLDFRGSHAVQVSTPALANLIRQYNPHVRVFRNELRELPPPREYREGEPVTVFFGALNREEDWRDIMPVLSEAAKKYGEGLRFRVLADKEFFAALETEHKEFIGDDNYYNGKYVPYPVYCQALRSSDIALLPLRDTRFNRMKSDLKFIESAGHGAAVLASPTVYRDTVKDGFTGFLYRSPEEFKERFAVLVEDRPRRLAMAEAAYRYVKAERLLSQHYEERLAWYRELLERQGELDRELLVRMME